MQIKIALYVFSIIIGYGLYFSLNSCDKSSTFSSLPSKLVLETVSQGTIVPNTNNEPIDGFTQEYLYFSELFPRDYKIVYATNVNISSSEHEESLVLFFRPSEKVASLLMLEYADELKSHRLLWQTKLTVSPNSEIILDIVDITSDGKKEIIVIGITPEDTYAIEIFSPNIHSTETDGFFATRIFTVVTERDISIRNENGLKQIIVNGVDENALLTETIYSWNVLENAFTVISSRRFSPEELLQNTLIELFQKDMREWATFLAGAWIPYGDNSKFIFFDESLLRVYLIDDEQGSLLDFRWIYLGKNLDTNNLIGQLKLRHYFYPTIESWMSVALSSDDTAIVRIDEYPEFNGEYTRVQQSDLSTRFNFNGINNLQQARILRGRLVGSFSDANSDTYFVFDYPEVIKYTGSTSEQFLFEVFELRENMYLQLYNGVNHYYMTRVKEESVELVPVRIQLDSVVADKHGFSYKISMQDGDINPPN